MNDLMSWLRDNVEHKASLDLDVFGVEAHKKGPAPDYLNDLNAAERLMKVMIEKGYLFSVSSQSDVSSFPTTYSYSVTMASRSCKHKRLSAAMTMCVLKEHNINIELREEEKPNE